MNTNILLTPRNFLLCQTKLCRRKGNGEGNCPLCLLFTPKRTASKTSVAKVTVTKQSQSVLKPVPVSEQSALSNKTILSNVASRVGNTPLIRLTNITRQTKLPCEVAGKCEFFNPSGSVKDRIALRIVENAEKEQRIKPGDTLVAATSGNFGISLAMIAAGRGYQCVAVVPDKISNDKVDILKALGATVEKTSSVLKYTDPSSQFEHARRLVKTSQSSYLIDQYTDVANYLTHSETTAKEILEQCGGKLDMIVCGVGSGGTITGLGRAIKDKCPNCVVIGVDPVGSNIAPSADKNPSQQPLYQVEGIGYDFVPPVCDRAIVDKWYKCTDRESFIMARKLIKEEGLLCGGSSGAAVDVALKAARDYKLASGTKVVVVLPDTAHNYMSKFMNEAWMASYGFLEDEWHASDRPRLWWWDIRVSCLISNTPLNVSHTVTIQEALDVLSKEGLEQLPVINTDTHEITGMTSVPNILKALTSGKVKTSDAISKAVNSRFFTVGPDEILGNVATILQTEPYVAVVHNHRQYLGRGCESLRTMIYAIVNRLDLLNFIAKPPSSSEDGDDKKHVVQQKVEQTALVPKIEQIQQKMIK